MKKHRHGPQIGNTSIRFAAAALLFLLCHVAVASPAYAQSDFPNRRIHLVLPYPAGGIVDVVTRIVTERLSANFGQPIVVEPKPGANGNLAWQQIARAAPDGYTWTFVSPALIANPRMQANVPFSEKDFVPVGGAVWVPWVLVVHPSIPVKTVKELVDYVHANPGKLNWANGGTGSSGHLNTAIFFNAAKLDMVQVPYRGQPPAIIDLIAGRVHFALSSPSLVLQHIQAGALRPLAIVAKNRLPQLPDVPTMSEAGYPETNVVAWYGYGVPKGTPADVVDKIVAGFNTALRDPGVRSALEQQMTEVMEPKTAAELQAMIAFDVEKYSKIIEEAGIKLQE